MGEANNIKVYSILGTDIKDKTREIIGPRKSPEEVTFVQKTIKREWWDLEGVCKLSQARETEQNPRTGLEKSEGWGDQQQVRSETSRVGSRPSANFGAWSWLGFFS